MFLVFWALLIIVFVLLDALYECVKASYTGLKTFAARFSDLIFLCRSSEYNKYLSGRKSVMLKNHSDFHYFRSTQFFNSLVVGIESVSVPAGSSYGLCAVLTANYSKIRDRITHPSFLADARSNLLKIYLICDEVQLNKILVDNRSLISQHENILDYSHVNLSKILAFMKLYFLYLYSLEDPDTARNLNARDFYSFIIPWQEYHPSRHHRLPMDRNYYAYGHPHGYTRWPKYTNSYYSRPTYPNAYYPRPTYPNAYYSWPTYPNAYYSRPTYYV